MDLPLQHDLSTPLVAILLVSACIHLATSLQHIVIQLHQQIDMHLKCLGQMLSDMSDTSGVTDPCLESGMFLSGSGIIVWCPSGHRLFSPHQIAARYTPDTYSRVLRQTAARFTPDSYSGSSQQASDHTRHSNNSRFKCIIGPFIGIIGTVVSVPQSSFQLCGRPPSVICQTV